MKQLFFAGFALIVRDYRVRFRRTLLGVFWFFVPLFLLIAVAMFLGRDVGLFSEENSTSYLVELIAGLIFWQVVSEAWGEPLRLARRANALIRAVPFDLNAILTAGAFSAFFSLIIKLPLLFGAMLWFGYSIGSNILFLPIGFLSLLALGAGMSCFFLPFSLGILDVHYAISLILAVCLATAPIFYQMPTTGAIYWINTVNPFTYFILPIRDFALGNGTTVYKLLAVFGASIILLLAGILFYNNKIRLAVGYVGR